MRGSFPRRSASSTARSPGATSPSSTVLPSAFETAFWETTTTSPSPSSSPLDPSALAIRSPTSSPGSISGMPATGTTSTRPPLITPPVP
jgi:hypothetical protein